MARVCEVLSFGQFGRSAVDGKPPFKITRNSRAKYTCQKIRLEFHISIAGSYAASVDAGRLLGLTSLALKQENYEARNNCCDNQKK